VSDLAVACSLMPAELRERKHNVLAQIRGAVSEVTELDNRFRYRFSSFETDASGI
jgi:hypothetical protein